MAGLLADLVLILHVAFVLFVVVGLALILLGMLLGWRWIRHFYFRLVHLLCIGLVVGESWVGAVCPLTRWENRLRDQAGQAGYGDRSFIGHWLGEWLYWDLPSWAFTVMYSVFGGLVLLVFLAAPPRAPRLSSVGQELTNGHNDKGS